MRTGRGRLRRVAPLAAGFAVVALLVGPGCQTGDAAEDAAGVQCGIKRIVQYATHPDVDPDRSRLDLYLPPAGERGCTDRPIVVWVHGGGWTEGDRSDYIADKVKLFNSAGYVLATVNYQLTDVSLAPPSPQYPVHNQDAADAVAWLIGNAGEFGGDAQRVALLGHSAGGGIVAAIATNERFLATHQLGLEDIQCAASMDGEGYDIAAGATTFPEAARQRYLDVFGSDPAVWAEASPITHVAAGTDIPDYFVAARGVDWRLAQHETFIGALRAADIPTTVADASVLSHGDLTTAIGTERDDVVTLALMEFLGGCFADA